MCQLLAMLLIALKNYSCNMVPMYRTIKHVQYEFMNTCNGRYEIITYGKKGGHDISNVREYKEINMMIKKSSYKHL